MPLMEEQVAASEEVLTELLDKLSDMVRQKRAEKISGEIFWGQL